MEDPLVPNSTVAESGMMMDSQPARLAIVCCLLSAGCSDPGSGKFGVTTSSSSSASSPAGPNDAEAVLTRMIQAYHEADSYADRGELRISFRRDGRPFESKVPFALALQRPNRLQLHLYQGHVVCDGTALWGWTEDLPGYLLKRPQLTPLTLGDLYADPVLRTVLSEGQAGGSLQLAMLLGVDALDLIRAGGERPELLSDADDGRPCRRVRVRRADGDLVYWIDREQYLLRRIDFPTRRLALTMAEPSPPTELVMTAEFIDPQINPKFPPDAFQFDPPASVQTVERLDPYVAIPPPPPQAQTLGTMVGDFKFVDLNGRSLERSELVGKPTVVYFWSLGSSDCLPVLGNLNAVYAKYRDRSDVRFLVVSIDPAGNGGVSDAELRDVLLRHKITIPAARDVGQSAVAAFDVRFVPNLFLLGRDGKIEDNEIGLNPKLVDELPGRIEQLIAGQSLVAAARERYQERVRKYEQSQAARDAAGGGAATLPQAPLAPAAEPKQLKMTRLWRTTDVAKPGYLLATDDKPARIIVADGLQDVVELDAAGKTVNRTKLDLPASPVEAVISFWRTAVDKQGRRVFVGSASAQQQLHVYDADFKRLLSFPEGTHAGISDVQLGDLDGDGEPEINIGYWGVVGLQNVGLDGTRRWSNRRLPENVLRLAVSMLDSRGKRLLLCTTGVMTVAVVDEKGEVLKEMPVGSRAVRFVTVGDLDGDGGIEMCGLATTGPGSDVAVGFDAVGRELWNYPLPPGVQQVPEMQNEMVASGKLLADEPGLWIFAGADGTVHLVDREGKPRDVFAWGEPIRGLAVATLDGRATLLIADAKSVTALQFAK
jgi:peroxiredoxin